MKKIIALVSIFAVVLGTSFAAQADDYKHELGISYGAASNSQIIDDFEDAIVSAATIGSAKFGHDHLIGPIAVDYFYHINPLVGVGAIGVFGVNNRDIFNRDNVKDGHIRHNYYTLMPAVKFDWLRKGHFGMYSKLGVGATLRSEKITDMPDVSDDLETAVHFNWQVSALGVEFGGESLRGFVELGFGEQGIALIGVRTKF